MVTFEMWKNGAANLTGKAVDKVRSVTDVSKFEHQLSENQKKLDQLYRELGQLYSEIHALDPESEFGPLLEQILEQNNKINDIRKQITSRKGQRECPHCGALLDKEAIFCSQCGEKIPEEEAPNREASDTGMRCRKCGARIRDGMRFCTSCGEPVIKQEDTSKNEQLPAKAQEITDKLSEREEYGVKVKGKMHFCACHGEMPLEQAQMPGENPEQNTVDSVLKQEKHEELLTPAIEPMPKSELDAIEKPQPEEKPHQKQKADSVDVPDGWVYCTSCGALVEAFNSFCTECGHKLPKSEPRKCPGCGAYAEQGQNFCRHCGARLK